MIFLILGQLGQVGTNTKSGTFVPTGKADGYWDRLGQLPLG